MRAHTETDGKGAPPSFVLSCLSRGARPRRSACTFFRHGYPKLIFRMVFTSTRARRGARARTTESGTMKSRFEFRDAHSPATMWHRGPGVEHRAKSNQQPANNGGGSSVDNEVRNSLSRNRLLTRGVSAPGQPGLVLYPTSCRILVCGDRPVHLCGPRASPPSHSNNPSISWAYRIRSGLHHAQTVVLKAGVQGDEVPSTSAPLVKER